MFNVNNTIAHTHTHTHTQADNETHARARAHTHTHCRHTRTRAHTHVYTHTHTHKLIHKERAHIGTLWLPQWWKREIQSSENQVKSKLFFVGCLTSQQQASVSQGRICSDIFTCCHTEVEDAVQTFYLTQSQYTDTGLTSPSADHIMPGAWQGSYWSANV